MTLHTPLEKLGARHMLIIFLKYYLIYLNKKGPLRKTKNNKNKKGFKKARLMEEF